MSLCTAVFQGRSDVAHVQLPECLIDVFGKVNNIIMLHTKLIQLD